MLRFETSAAADARSFTFHPTQALADEPDGVPIVRFRAGGLLQVAHHLMTWSPTVTVIAPQRLFDILMKQVEALCGHCQDANAAINVHFAPLRALYAFLEERDGASQPTPARLALAEAVEAAALAVLRERKFSRPLDVNVEFYTALLLEALGFPADAFTCVFAMSRTAGWIAHAREQVTTGRLIRPQSRYIGPAPQRAA